MTRRLCSIGAARDPSGEAHLPTKDKSLVTVPGTDSSSLSIPPAAPTSALPPCTSCQSVLPSSDANVAPAPPGEPLPARSLARKSLHPGSLSSSKKVCAVITRVYAQRVNGCHGQINMNQNNGCLRKARQALCTSPATADHGPAQQRFRGRKSGTGGRQLGRNHIGKMPCSAAPGTAAQSLRRMSL